MHGIRVKDARLEKRVRLASPTYEWLRGKDDIVDASWIISVVLGTPHGERDYYDKDRNRFLIRVRRKVGNRKKSIILRVEETDTEYVVLLPHMEDNWR